MHSKTVCIHALSRRLLFPSVSVAILCILATSCTLNGSANHEAEDAARHWAEAYFNCNYHEAEHYCTEESGKWLRFAASNTTADALKLLEGQDTEVRIDGCSVADDTTAFVTFYVKNYLKPVAVGEAAEIAKEGFFLEHLVCRNGHWKIKMEGLPRSIKKEDPPQNEMQSRD